ncbi:MAG TPA: TonB-dependent receptor [Terracidiphilus sp.]|nr:TonB-dependent receptor [Terracidiphilus sp.]
MAVSATSLQNFRRGFARLLTNAFTCAALALSLSAATLCHAASIRGTVTDSSGAKVSGAAVVLISNGAVVGSAVSHADGSFEITTGTGGRFFLVISAKSFRQLQTPDFYAGRFDSIERDLVLEPAWVQQSIVVTANGTPTPQPQTSSATTVLSPLDLAQRMSLTDALRTVPGVFEVQTGQRGAEASLFVRGGDSDDNMVLLDGVDVGDLGNQFDFGPFSTTGVESAEIYRGPDSNLYGAGAMTSVVNITTPRGTTSFPSLLLEGSGGNFNTSQQRIEFAGARGKLDYLGSYSWLQTGNALTNDAYHLGAAAANLGWQPKASTQIRGTAHYNVSATGVPNAWSFYHVTDNATQKDQDLYVSGSIANQTTASFHNTVRYGLVHKREQYSLWQQSGSGTYDAFGDSLGYPVTILGANGYSATGQAVLDYAQTYPYQYQLASDRDELVYQGELTATPHLAALIGFEFADERGFENVPTFASYDSTERTNYNYLATIHGDFKTRFFYTLGGSLEHYSLFGVQTTPRAGFSYYVLRARSGVFSGTRILFNYGDAVREPKLTDEFGSLYHLLVGSGFQSTAAQLAIGPLTAPTVRMYEGGLAQGFLSDRVIFRATYFHNQFGREIEYVGGRLLPNLIPGLTPDQQTQLETALGYYYTDDYGLAVNTEAYRAQGAEGSIESGLGHNIFLRGGYTYLDAVVQRSFDSDNEALLGGYEPTYNGIPIGAYSPLVGARPFRRAPHTGYFTASYSGKRITGMFTSSFASRSDDSTYLAYADANGGNSLLLPNRNLDRAFAQLDLGGSYKISSWIDIFAQANNLASDRHIAPIGYVSLPMNVRAGLRVRWGLGKR